MSETPKIYGAICEILNDVEPILKSCRNQSQNFNFRGIDQVYAALHPLLAKHRVFPTSKVIDLRREERQTKSGTTMIYSIITMEYTFWAEDGSSVSTQVVGEASDSADKASNKGASTAYKYAIFQMLCIPTEAIDPDYETHEIQYEQPPQREVQKPSAPPPNKPREQPPTNRSEPVKTETKPAASDQPQRRSGLVCPKCGEAKLQDSLLKKGSMRCKGCDTTMTCEEYESGKVDTSPEPKKEEAQVAPVNEEVPQAFIGGVTTDDVPF